MENIKIETHVYQGNNVYQLPCKSCGKEMNNEIHVRNGGTICDTEDGPCACGAWHKTKVSDEAIRIARFTISRWASLNEKSEPDHKDLVNNWLKTEFKNFILNKNGEQL